ncbi:MAG: hypothetical protein ACI4WM_03040 [Erysipelotrichaceae bacterium]
MKVTTHKIGNDYLIVVEDGISHIGTTVMAVPYLKDGVAHATLSTINLTGHKDDEIATMYAKKLCELSGKVCVCICGVHFDNISEERISLIMNKAKQKLKEMEDEYNEGNL